jgi:hypothetical protein
VCVCVCALCCVAVSWPSYAVRLSTCGMVLCTGVWHRSCSLLFCVVSSNVSAVLLALEGQRSAIKLAQTCLQSGDADHEGLRQELRVLMENAGVHISSHSLSASPPRALPQRRCSWRGVSCALLLRPTASFSSTASSALFFSFLTH